MILVILAAGAAIVATALLVAWTFQRVSQETRRSREIMSESRAHMELLRKNFTDEIHRQNQNFSQQLNHLSGSLSQTLTETRQSVRSDMQNSAGIMADLSQKLGELGEASRRILDVGKDISGLQDLLKPPKIRGQIGEYFLGELLGQILPRQHFTMQHAFRDGRVVDAVIRIGENLVCVDAKFPLEVFRSGQEEAGAERKEVIRREFLKGVRKHIDDIAKKYIVPLEGTLDFALMYIPAENVYYETIVRDGNGDGGGLFEYAIHRKVIPVSPNSIYAYLQVILMGLKGFQVERETKEILAHLRNLKTRLGKFEEEFLLVGRHLSNTTKCYEKAQGSLDRFGNEIRVLEGADEPARALPDNGNKLE